MNDEADGGEGLTAAQFHARPGVGDWRVTSWGPQAFFRSTSLRHAAQLLPAIVEEAARFELAPDVDLRVTKGSSSASRTVARNVSRRMPPASPRRSRWPLATWTSGPIPH